MKFSILMIVIVLCITVKAQDMKTPTDNNKSIPIFDQLLINYLAMFEKKFQSHTITKEDISVLQYLLKLIYIRQEQIDKEEKAKPVVYWYSRQGRNYETFM